MLSRVADSLYWMSRYFERADGTARAIEAAHGLILSRGEDIDSWWMRALIPIGLQLDPERLDPHDPIRRLATDASNRSSILSCLTASRENASQVREAISSEMWEQVNRVYHEVVRLSMLATDDEMLLRLLATVRDATYAFHGAADTTMPHGEGWRFVQLGKYAERACAVAILLDAFFTTPGTPDDLDWIALLAGCAAVDAYSKVFTADLQPDRIIRLLLVHPEFPYSVRYSAEQMHGLLRAIAARAPGRQAAHIDRLAGRLRSSLEYADVRELISGDLHGFLNGVLDGCRAIHSAVHDAYIDYPIETAFEA